eukprot:13763879-Heterocapsa_arctica.AAC.1
MSFKKGQRGSTVTWIAGVFSVMPYGVNVQVKEEIVRDVEQGVEDLQMANVVAIKKLRSFVGKASSVASL